MLTMIARSRTDSENDEDVRVTNLRGWISQTEDDLRRAASKAGARPEQLNIVHLDVLPSYFLLLGAPYDAYFHTYELTATPGARLPVASIDIRHDAALRALVEIELPRIFEDRVITRNAVFDSGDVSSRQ